MDNYDPGFMTQHPLRDKLSNDDWKRIQFAVDSGDTSNISADELCAANDVMIDHMAVTLQTHISVITLQ